MKKGREGERRSGIESKNSQTKWKRQSGKEWETKKKKEYPLSPKWQKTKGNGFEMERQPQKKTGKELVSRILKAFGVFAPG